MRDKSGINGLSSASEGLTCYHTLVKSLSQKQRGLSIGIVLLLVLVVATLGLTLAGGSSTQLWFSLREDSVTRATNGARSVAAATIESIFASPDLEFGNANENVELTLPELDWARLTFSVDQAADWGIPYSTSNVDSTQTVLGWGKRVVPAGAVHIVAVAKAGNLERTVEAFLRVEHFPYAIASSGPIQTSGSLTVATLDSKQPGQYSPADIVSNSDQSDALVLAAGSLVTGDAQAVGDVRVNSPATTEVWGEVRSGADPVQLQRLDFVDLDPKFRLHEPLGSSVYSQAPTVFDGTVRRQGDLTIMGDLEMDAAYLFVTGDLTVTGDLSGAGIIVVEGDATIQGMATLAGANKMALVAGGAIDLTGDSANTSSFRGLVYTQDSFTARRVTVKGALVVDGDGSSRVSLHDTKFFHEPLVVESTGPRDLINYPMATVLGEATFSVVNYDNRKFEVYHLSDIDGVVEDIDLFLADPSSYPTVVPQRSADIADILFDQPGGTPAHEAAINTLIGDLRTSLTGFIPTAELDVALGRTGSWEDWGPLILETTMKFSDASFGLGNKGLVFAPNQVLELGEFLRPEERTRLLFWQESGRLVAPSY